MSTAPSRRPLFAHHVLCLISSVLPVYALTSPQACKFRDEYSAFTQAGAAVFGISSDSPAENKAWADANRLPFPLLTDPSSILRKVRRAAAAHFNCHLLFLCV